jgi:hypothetical protein
MAQSAVPRPGARPKIYSLRSWHWPNHRADADRRTAQAGPPRPTAYRSLGRDCARQPRQRCDARPARSHGRPHRSPKRTLHGHRQRHPMEPHHPCLLSTSHPSRPARQNRAHRVHAEAPDHPQCHPPRPSTLEDRLTGNTVTQAAIALAVEHCDDSAAEGSCSRPKTRAPSALDGMARCLHCFTIIRWFRRGARARQGIGFASQQGRRYLRG